MHFALDCMQYYKIWDFFKGLSLLILLFVVQTLTLLCIFLWPCFLGLRFAVLVVQRFTQVEVSAL